MVHKNTLVGAAGTAILFWDITTFNLFKKFEIRQDSIYSLAVVPQKNFLLVGTWEHHIYIYNLDTHLLEGEPLGAKSEGHIGAVYALAVSGNRLYSGSFDSTIKMWSLDIRKCLQTTHRHLSSINALSTHRDVLFSASADQTIKVWKFK